MKTTFEERVTATKMNILTVVVTVWNLVIAGSVILGGELWWGVFTVAFAAILALVLRIFNVLHLKVDEQGFQASFSGLITKQISFDDIQKVEERRYRWTEFMGWGLRGNFKGHMTYSILGVTTCLRIYRKDGTCFVVSCWDTERAKEAIDRRLSPFEEA